MVKKAAAAIAIAAIVAGALYVAGFRVALDGSGMLPRFIASSPDYDALEADRARQRTAAPSPRVSEERPVMESASPAAPVMPPNAEAPPPRRPALAVWPDFRGPARDGRSSEAINTEWPAGGLPQLWKQPI